MMEEKRNEIKRLMLAKTIDNPDVIFSEDGIASVVGIDPCVVMEFLGNTFAVLCRTAGMTRSYRVTRAALVDEIKRLRNPLTEEQLRNLLITSFEGGSNYWMEDYEIRTRPTQQPTGGYTWEVPLLGGSLSLAVLDDDKLHVLDRNALDKGAEIFAREHPKHYADLLATTDDAITGDVFLQCCVFGNTIFS